ncbi:MAG TPA: HEPN domain-containing protein [Ignavibacteria bacterium]|nr:DNA-binding protein [Bacteroidota bacterium]HRE10382.1 HEPN domain-containing protein [Ignavibacteria bacterium]HRF65045.1 HEPN domain-containing protein [Ignavibacteria bacterium]HRJ05543.1 HEPN domain-containing protein [Ignavibacteria bacterium]HRJ85928.1 HEPN domain-containing protein [Ignavibacteria bacterium]
MNKSEKIAYWLEIAEYDLKTAKVMLEGKRYVYVGFMCHPTIEKSLKALYSNIFNETPPFTHNLLLLAQECRLIDLMEEFQIDFLNILQPLNIEARYPAYKNMIGKNLNLTKAKKLLKDTIQFHKWIKSML